MSILKQLRNYTSTFLKWLIKTTSAIKLPGLEGLSLYNLWKIYSDGIIKGTFSTRASSIAYSFFMALFPFIIFVFNLIPYIDIADFKIKFLILVDILLPTEAQGYFGEIFNDIVSRQRGGLLSLSFFLSIFLMTNGVNAIFTGFEFSYHTKVNRSIIKQYLVALGVSLFLVVILLIAVGIIVYSQYAIEGLLGENPFSNYIDKASVITYISFIALIYTVVAILYYFGTKEAKQSRFFSVGAFFTTILILVSSFLFGLYIENFSNYNELYGSIGALLILMVYIWLNSNILLLGFELNASLVKLKENFE
ncbi:YihY/virulence factor BrkB family protein [Zunongwangia sp.]|uniref:YihY/virulence factor BrkB family protein n=1 Tax=Zunongwangia sp. TaxID=1965325 RepID=UPI003AA8F093